MADGFPSRRPLLCQPPYAPSCIPLPPTRNARTIPYLVAPFDFA